MARYRIFYLCILLAAIAFYIFDTGYIPFLLLIATLLYLPLELLLSLFARWKVSVQLQPEKFEVYVQEDASILASYQSLLPISRIKMQVVMENLMTGEVQHYKFRFKNGGNQQESIMPFFCTHCGVIRCTVTKVALVDYAGIFSLPLKKPQTIFLQIRPKTEPYEENIDGLLDGHILEGVTQKSGKEGERSTVKEYQPGDPVRNMHWKLTSKMMTPMVREAESSFDPTILLAFNFQGTPEQMDNILARLEGIAYALLDSGYTFCLVWYDPDAIGLCKHLVENRETFQKAIWRICSSKLPEKSQDICTCLKHLEDANTECLFLIEPDRVYAPYQLGGVSG